MKVFIAGATGAIGRPLVSQLVAEGHEVAGMVRNEENRRRINEQGANGVIADALNTDAVHAALARTRPDVVINQLTALPKHYTAEAMRAAQPMYRKLRAEGGANLEAAAQAVGIQRYILQSGAFLYAPGDGLATEDTRFASDESPRVAFYTKLYQEIEQRAFSLSNIGIVVLRYGFLYGPGTWYALDGDVADQMRHRKRPVVGDGEGVWSWVHVEDAARAAVLAVTLGAPGVYNVVDDDPSPMRTWLPEYARWLGAPTPLNIPADQVSDDFSVYYATRLRGASNAKAKRELEFRPRALEWMATAAEKRTDSLA